jgi:hypothetical protein
MEKDRRQRYVETLEQTMKSNHSYLKGAIDTFQEMCKMVAPERDIPLGIINDIRESYKEIQNRLTEIKAIQQLLQAKYRQYYRRNPQRDKEILEFG